MTKRNIECHTTNCKHVNSKRTNAQNSALWLYFTLCSVALNDAGYSVQEVLRSFKTELSWNKDSFHDIIWIPMQKHVTKKTSTTELNKVKEIEEVFEEVNRFLSQKGVHVDFPNDPTKHEEKQYITSHEKINYPTKFEEPKL